MRSGRAVVIVGAAGAVGALLVERFLANGDAVVACDRGEEGLAGLPSRLGSEAEARLTTVVADVSEEADCADLAEAAAAANGRVDVLINCAGWFPSSPFREIEAGEWRQVIEVNLTGGFLVTQALLPLMEGRGWGRIVNFGSASFFAGAPTQAHYVAAKGGVIGLSRSLANTLGPEGITVNVITPGLILTDAVREGFPAPFVAAQKAERALRRDLLPQDLVGPAFFLASPDADLVTGQVLNVDGGKFMP